MAMGGNQLLGGGGELNLFFRLRETISTDVNFDEPEKIIT